MKNIFLIGRDYKFSEKLKEFLEFTQNYKVIVSEPDKYIEALEENASFDLILLDLSPPETAKGFEILLFLKSDRELKNKPVAILTMEKDTEIIFKALKEGCACFIDKTEDFETLKEKVDRLFKSLSLKENA